MMGRALVVLALLALTPACGSSSDSNGGHAGSGGSGATGGSGGSGAIGGSGGSGAIGGAAGSSSGGSAGSAACDALDQKLQKALDDARVQTKSRDATYAITTPECGQKVYVSGDTPVTPDELFRIGSVTKTYTASVILKLLAAGKLSLDDTADKYVTGVPNGDQITLHMLLQHMSGLFNYTTDPGFASQLLKTWTPEELIAISASHPVDFAPGAKWEYSNTNFIVLGLVAEKVGGKPLAQQIRELLLTPNSLAHTFLDGSEPLGGTLAPAYDAVGSDATHAIDPSAAWAAGAMTATPADEADWITLLGSGKIHDPAIQAQMEDGVSIGSGTGASYGLGLLMLDPSITGGAGKGFGHDGAINGYYTQAFYFPDKQVTIASIVNQDGANPNDLTAAALTALFQ